MLTTRHGVPRAAHTAAHAAPPDALPFDCVARFDLRGMPGNVLQDVVNIPPDAAFVAVAIGYGFEQERSEPLQLQGSSKAKVPGDITLGELPVRAVVEGFRVNPRSENIVFQGDGSDPDAPPAAYSTEPLPRELLDKALELVRRPDDLSFMFSLVDSSSGRELQDEPMQNVASLGSPRGERPFRPLARPLTFLPRSTVRMQVVERTPNVRGRLYVSLHGYQVVVGSACPEPLARVGTAAAASAIDVGAGRVIPFDYVGKVRLSGRPGNVVEDVITVADGGFVATSIGYGLAVGDDPFKIALPQPDANRKYDLRSLPVRAIPASTLRDGIRIKPEYLRLVLGTTGRLRKSVAEDLATNAFERLNRPEDVSFLYSFADTGAGREWQNRSVHNVAGLGIADGQRPFRRLARPRAFPPRSSIRVRVEERFGSGTLYFAFQGFKVLGSPTRGRP